MKHNEMIHPDFHYGDQEHQHYERWGYCIFNHFLMEQALQWCSGNIEGVLQRLHPGCSSEAIINAHQLGETWIYELATQPKVLDLVERQVGPNILLWSSHLLCKQPRTGNLVPWHQDAPYWNVSGRLSGAVWIPFDDVDETNGTMAVIPGWHTKGTLTRRQRPDQPTLFTQEIDTGALPKNLDEIQVLYRLRGGQCAIHHTMLPHNSFPNKSNRWRRVLVLRYMAADGIRGGKVYDDYRTGAKFDREFYLVRGEDVTGAGLKRFPDHYRESVLQAT